MTQAMSKPELSVSADLSDSIDGLTRLITDVARFGFDLRRLSVQVQENGFSRAEMTLASQAEIDSQTIAERFNRHPSMRAVEVALLQQEDTDD